MLTIYTSPVHKKNIDPPNVCTLEVDKALHILHISLADAVEAYLTSNLQNIHELKSEIMNTLAAISN